MTHLFNTVLKSYPQHPYNNKKAFNWKEGAELSLFADDLILYIETPKTPHTHTHKKNPRLINEFSELQDVKLIHRVYCTSIH